ncbi:MAG: glucosamine-6-phosphate deaminase [Candidatus Eremiobacteraeota bacterium]|nr:glucosamine-6-phosphate deaminase [Candidatus Eremiobacteraeota bacterium]
MEVIIKADYDAICDEAAGIVLEEWKKKPGLVLGCATGSTPLGVYGRLIEFYRKGEMDFSHVRTFNLDEYIGLEESHPQSYAFYMDTNLFSQVNIKRENIHRLKGKPRDIDGHCREYEEAIRRAGGIDVQLLGIGRNGHVGFNEPTSSLRSRTRVKTLTEATVQDNARCFLEGEMVPRFVLTMGIGTLMEARLIVLMSSGVKKQDAIRATVEGPVTASVPGSVLQLHPSVKLIVDEESSALLAQKEYYRYVYEHKGRVGEYLA